MNSEKNPANSKKDRGNSKTAEAVEEVTMAETDVEAEEDTAEEKDEGEADTTDVTDAGEEAVEAEVTVGTETALQVPDLVENRGQEAATREEVRTVVQIRVRPHPEFAKIFQVILEDGTKRLATKNLAPGRNVYGERLIRIEGVEYRVWDAFRSKLAGAILKGLKTIPIGEGSKVLYLGAASGTTPSHISDIVGGEGHVYCVEFAQRSLRELVSNVVAYRSNMSPFLADARMPQKYAMFISERVDVIYCDIATLEQAKVLADNADVFLKESGWIMLAVKSQSIDVTLPPEQVYQMQAQILRQRGFKVEQVVDLEPYDHAHAMIVAQR